tara:strand:+ start:4136 stop:4483 length:348 start_codon:yes stop_codon:yes gene_type:complete
MPTYEYVCRSCSHEFEEFQSITARSLRKCPRCAKLSLKRLIGTGAGVIFKGSGFYETDYRSENYKKQAKEESKNASKTSKSDDKKSGKNKSSKQKKVKADKPKSSSANKSSSDKS